jgi:hypothetical protein
MVALAWISPVEVIDVQEEPVDHAQLKDGACVARRESSEPRVAVVRTSVGPVGLLGGSNR